MCFSDSLHEHRTDQHATSMPSLCRRWLSIALLFAGRFEAFVEIDCALRYMPVEGQREEDFLWHAFMHKSGHVFEPEFYVVIGVAYEAASLCIQIFQT